MRTFFFLNFYTPQDITLAYRGEIVKHYRFKDLAITSTKGPFNTNLLWEHATYGIFMVDSTNQTVLLHSTKTRLIVDGSDWDIVDLSANTNSYKIQAGWLDGNDLWLVMCDNDGTADDFEVCFIEFDDSNDCNPVAVSAGADVNTVYAFDIFKIGTDHFVINKETRGGVLTLVCWDVDAAFVEKADFLEDEHFTDNDGFYFGIVTGTKYYSFMSYKDGDGPILYIQYDNSVPVFTIPVVAGIGDYIGPTDKNMRGVAYDGSDTLIFVGKQIADSKNYLISYVVSTSVSTIGAEYNIGLQIDRNNAGTIPNEFEKAFGITNEITYEIKARRGGIRVLQNLSDQLSGNIVGITDNFLFAINGGNWDIFEFTDVTKEISTILYNDGTIGILKKGTFTVHPDFHANWSKGDSIKIYDRYDQLEFHGLITAKNRNARGIYVYKIDSFTNEIYRKTYENAYSRDDMDTKQKDVIDNACDFCYRSSSIVGTTLNYDYNYNRAIIYLFWLARFLERQVPYVEPDGKIWTKAHDGLVPNDMIYAGTYNFKDEADGASGTDIDFVDAINTAAGCEIIAEHNGHRKVLKITAGAAAPNVATNYFDSVQTAGTIEYYFEVSAAANYVYMILYDTFTEAIMIRMNGANLQYRDLSAVWHTIKVVVPDTRYQIRIDFDCATDRFDCYVDGVQEVTAGEFRNAVTDVDRFAIGCFNNDKITYWDAIGYSWDPAYTVGDNEVAWDINNHWQDVFLVDIPGIEERMQGFFSGNTGITRNTIRYKNNTITIRPVAATRDPIEQLQGIIPLNEFRDPKLVAATEANQLGDNRYNIWSSDIIFLGLRIEGQGYLQPGKTIEIQNTGQKTISQDDFLILSFERDPKNDVYVNMILSDNIIFPAEFINLQYTSGIQIHTASVQALENQAAIAGIKAPLIYPFFIFGTLGFVETGNYGACLEVAFSDTNATINSSFWVHEGGNFKIRIIHSGSGNNFGKTIGGIYSISYDVDGGLQTWDAGTIDFNIPADDNRVIGVDDSAVVYTITSNSKVGLHYAKDDNAGGAAGNMQVYGIILVRQ